ncbi:ECF transporter S component [Vagococcus sp. BWB3-3]|uniref:ECF transporter S component n=1 Tax=Vagococcus allomyrinae TaxID=2794353 RepID=A0A940PB93_9ENTE|nr:ECF transporter S component [Vagococcus allomyrinae]MBP1040848.1 ECF transporter S component [Vagococcus allomyrinae]
MQNSNKNAKITSVFSVKEIANLSLMVAACVVGRLLFQFIPNVQPMTTILLIMTIYRGLRQGLVVSLLSVIITNLYLGMGVWTVAQLFSYAIIMCLVGLLAKWPLFKRNLLLQTAFSFLAGFLYGFIISLVSYKMYGMTAFWPYYIQGLSFDLLHAVGNLGFYIMLAPLFRRLLDKFDPQ